MLCLIAGASSLQLPGMRGAAPSLLASPQRPTRCSLHVMSGLASAGVDFKAGQTESARIITESARIIGLAIVSAAALLSSSLSIQFKWTFSALGFASAVYGHIRRALPARCLPAR